MPTPAPIGSVYYNEPRAAKIREPEDLSQIHSAVGGMIHVTVDSLSEANYLLSDWAELMAAVNEKAQELLTAFRDQTEPN